MSKQGGDDLDDDFVPDDLVALSEDEDAGQSAEGDDVGAFLSAGEEDEPRATGAQGATMSASEKKRKRRAKEKERRAKKRRLAETLDPVEAPSIAAQPPVILADYLSSMQAKTFAKMSSIELADVQIPGRELDSGHHAMDWVQESGPTGGFHNQDGTHTAYSFVAETQVQRVADVDIPGWSGAESSGRHTNT